MSDTPEPKSDYLSRDTELPPHLAAAIESDDDPPPQLRTALRSRLAEIHLRRQWHLERGGEMFDDRP